MTTLVTMLPARMHDADRVERFVRSYERHAGPLLPLVVVVPDPDVPGLSARLGSGIEIVPEQVLAPYLDGVEAPATRRAVVKLAFATLGRSDAYLCADDRAILVSWLDPGDLLADDGRPFTFASEDAERRVSAGRDEQERLSVVAGVRAQLGLSAAPVATCRSMALVEAREARDLLAWLEERFGSVAAALAEWPDPLGWYTFWTERAGDRVVREPIFRTLDAASRTSFALTGVTPADVPRGYVGVVVEDDGPEPSRSEALAAHVDAGTLAHALALRTTRTAPRVQRWLNLR